MKQASALFLFMVMAGASFAQTDTLTAKGIYNGKNLFIQQPKSEAPCALYVIANNKKLDEGYLRYFSSGNGKGIEVRFDSLKLKAGDPLEAKIIFNTACRPKVLNPEVLQVQRTCEFISIGVQGDSLIWVTSGEQGSLPFIVEQFKWNKWVNVGELKGKGTGDKNRYACKVLLTSGENMFRVRHLTYINPKISPQVIVQSKQSKVTFTHDKVKENILFSAVTQFEVYDRMGMLLKKGIADRIDCSGLKPGTYYLNFDNQMKEFTKN